MSKKNLHHGAIWVFRLRAYFILIGLSIFIPLFITGLIGIALITGLFSFLLAFIIIYIFSIVIIGEIYARMSYNRWFYEFTSTNLRIEKGIIWKRYSNIPYERVQNVDITRGILARMLGFSTVNIQTAGYSYSQGKNFWSEGYIPAVDMKEAEHVREFLMNKIGNKTKGGL